MPQLTRIAADDVGSTPATGHKIHKINRLGQFWAFKSGNCPWGANVQIPVDNGDCVRVIHNSHAQKTSIRRKFAGVAGGVPLAKIAIDGPTVLAHNLKIGLHLHLTYL
jgi:hypothetical protein